MGLSINAAAPLPSFSSGGATGITREELERRRRYEQALAAQSARPIQGIGDGIQSATASITAALVGRETNKREKNARNAASQDYQALLRSLGGPQGGTSQPQPSQPLTSSQPSPAASSGGQSIYDAIQHQESRGNPSAVSPKGARGLMQIMPDTARDPGYGVPNIFDLGRQMGRNPADTSDASLNQLLADPEVNRAFGEQYFDAMLEANGGDQTKALASYNAGPGAVQKYGGVPPYAETQAYVRAIEGNLGGAGAAQPANTQLAADPQPVPQQQAGPDLSQLAQLAGNDFLSDGERQIVSALLARQFAEPDQGTTMMQNYRMSQQDPGFADFMLSQRRAGATNVTVGDSAPQVGTIPQGYQLEQDGNSWRMAPIPGGPADRDVQAEEQARANAAEGTGRAAGIVLEDIGRIRQMVESNPRLTTGVGGVIMQQIAGTDAADVKALSETVRSNIGFDRLQQMREASPTGGALGNVTERELAGLQAVLGNLEQSQSSDQLLFNLERLDEVYRGILDKAAAYPNAAEFGFSQAPKRGDRRDRRDGPPAGMDADLWEEMTPEERSLWN